MGEWTLGIQDLSWVEHTAEEVDFVVEALGLKGVERVLDLACGFGRHSLELARRGYRVVGRGWRSVGLLARHKGSSGRAILRIGSEYGQRSNDEAKAYH